MKIVIVGCGRMGQGIAITFALAGHPIELIDTKKRTKKELALVLKNTNKFANHIAPLNNIQNR